MGKDQPKIPKQTGAQELFVQKPTAAVSRTRSDNYRTIYTNNVQVGVSFYDLRLHLNDVISSTSDLITVEELASVVMSPENAKHVSEALVQSIAHYEEKFGPIRPLKPPTEPETSP